MRRALLLPLGLLTLAALWLGPLPALAPAAFFAHMTLHMGVVAVAAPLIAFGLAGSRWDPARRAPALFAPILASAVEFAVVWAWHAPQLHHTARHQAGGLIAEQASFFAAAFFVWMAAVGDPDGGGERKGAGIVALLLTFMHISLLGVLLSVAQRPLYEHGEIFGGLAALEDQQLGGAIMLVGGTAYLLGGLRLTSALLRGRARERKPG